MSAPGAAPAPILTDAELKLLQALVYHECGMHFDERRTHFLQDRLLRRLKECRADSFYSYYRLLIGPSGKQELAKLVEQLTVNETSFFRHKAQLDLFQKTVLEDLLKQKLSRRDYSIRVWSADETPNHRMLARPREQTRTRLENRMVRRIPCNDAVA